MGQKIKTVINMADLLAPIISSRDLLERLRNRVKKAETSSVDLDFSEVEFISRSAAHELLSMKEDFKRSFFNKKELSFVNTDNDVSEMLRIVASNRALPKIFKPDFKAERIKIESLL